MRPLRDRHIKRYAALLGVWELRDEGRPRSALVTPLYTHRTDIYIAAFHLQRHVAMNFLAKAAALRAAFSVPDDIPIAAPVHIARYV